MEMRDATRLVSHNAIVDPDSDISVRMAIDRRDIHDLVTPDEPFYQPAPYSRHQTGVGVGIIAERLASTWGYRITEIEAVDEHDDLVEVEAIATTTDDPGGTA